MYTYYLNGTELLGRVKIIEVVLISCDGGEAVGSIMTVRGGAVTNNVHHLLHAMSTSSNYVYKNTYDILYIHTWIAYIDTYVSKPFTELFIW